MRDVCFTSLKGIHSFTTSPLSKLTRSFDQDQQNAVKMSPSIPNCVYLETNDKRAVSYAHKHMPSLMFVSQTLLIDSCIQMLILKEF